MRLDAVDLLLGRDELIARYDQPTLGFDPDALRRRNHVATDSLVAGHFHDIQARDQPHRVTEGRGVQIVLRHRRGHHHIHHAQPLADAARHTGIEDHIRRIG